VSENKINRLSQLDILKVLAAFFVCVYHLHWVDSSILSTVFRYGYLGVNVFFCISGFITPLVLIRGKYDYSKIFSFIVSRFFRLYPAFAFIAIVEMKFSFISSYCWYSHYSINLRNGSHLWSSFLSRLVPSYLEKVTHSSPTPHSSLVDWLFFSTTVNVSTTLLC